MRELAATNRIYRVVALTDAASIAWNCDTTDEATVTLGGNRTVANPTGTPLTGQRIMFRLAQDATGGRTVAWGTAFAFPRGMVPLIDPTALAVNVFEFVYSNISSRWELLAQPVYGVSTGPVANLYQSAASSIANNTATAIPFQAEGFDTHNGHDNAANNTRWTCPAGWSGYYDVAGAVFFATGASGVRLAWLRKNGNADVFGSMVRRGPVSTGDGDGLAVPMCIVTMAVGDYVELVAQHTQGAAVNTLVSAAYRCGLNVGFRRAL